MQSVYLKQTLTILITLLLIAISVGCDIEGGPPPLPKPGIYYYPVYNHTGSHIAFVWETESAAMFGIQLNARSGLWIMDSTGSDRQLLALGIYINSPEFSFDDNWIVFVDDGVVKKVEVDGDSIVTLYNSGRSTEASYSANAQFVTFTSNQNGPYLNSYGLWYMQSNGENSRCILVNGDSEMRARSPVFHPVKSTIIFFEILIGIVETDTSGILYRRIEELTYTSAPGKIVISPTGNQILYDMNYQIWSVNYDGSDARIIMPTSSSMPSWSSDGQKILYVAADPEHEHNVIWKMNADGTDAQPLTRVYDDIEQ